MRPLTLQRLLLQCSILAVISYAVFCLKKKSRPDAVRTLSPQQPAASNQRQPKHLTSQPPAPSDQPKTAAASGQQPAASQRPQQPAASNQRPAKDHSSQRPATSGQPKD